MGEHRSPFCGAVGSYIVRFPSPPLGSSSQLKNLTRSDTVMDIGSLRSTKLCIQNVRSIDDMHPWPVKAELFLKFKKIRSECILFVIHVWNSNVHGCCLFLTVHQELGLLQPQSKVDTHISDQNHCHSDFVPVSHGMRGDRLLPDKWGSREWLLLVCKHLWSEAKDAHVVPGRDLGRPETLSEDWCLDGRGFGL